MSGSNAISGITVVGAIIAASSTASAGGTWDFGRWLAASAGAVAAALAMTNVVGGFLVTHRMLGMFQARTNR
jgi:NAD(P) transhydrogenase subunit alpha